MQYHTTPTTPAELEIATSSGSFLWRAASEAWPEKFRMVRVYVYRTQLGTQYGGTPLPFSRHQHNSSEAHILEIIHPYVDQTLSYIPQQAAKRFKIGCDPPPRNLPLSSCRTPFWLQGC